jgi:hypothetical protein
MGEMADSLFDDYSDFDLDGDELQDTSKSCNRCGATDLHWVSYRNRWRLADEDGLFHDCHMTSSTEGFKEVP